MSGFAAPQPSVLTRLRQRISLRTLALASLALNLFLGAMLVATIRNPPPPPYRPMPDRFVEHVAADLSDADAAVLRTAFEPLRPRYDALSQDYREAGQRVRALLQAEPVDFDSLRAATSAARRLSAIRQFHQFLVSEQVRTDDPTAIVAGPKKARRLPKVLTVAEVDTIIERAESESRRSDLSPPARLRALRLHALMELIYASGLRVSELVALPAAAARQMTARRRHRRSSSQRTAPPGAACCTT